MSESVASTLASGSQDLAALIGLFATDGVEKNVLATQFGWCSVVVSSLSLLGVLGLVKSSMKLALGLSQCSAAGFNLDSLRGIFGYLPEESTIAGSLVKCEVAKIKVSAQGIEITKSTRYYSGTSTPIVNVVSEVLPYLSHSITVNLGNLKGEQGIAQNPVLIAFVLFVCSGLTTWLLQIVTTNWTWLKIIAIPGLHACLMILLAIPLWYDRQINRPGKQLTVDKWDGLHDMAVEKWSAAHGTAVRTSQTFNLLQVCLENQDVLHFWGNTSLIESKAFQCIILLLSAFAATAYICQYAILKAASSRQALIWIGSQGVLAAVRVGYWIIDPSFDDPSVTNYEIVQLNCTGSARLTLPELICNTFGKPTLPTTLKIPPFALAFLGQHPLHEILHIAASRSKTEVIPTDAEICAFLNTDLHKLISRRWIALDGNPDLRYRLVLCRVKDAVNPILMVEVPYAPFDPELDKHGKEFCWMEAVSPPRGSGPLGPIAASCTLFAMTAQGKRLHLRSLNGHCDIGCTWRSDISNTREHEHSGRYLEDRSMRLCAWIKSISNQYRFRVLHKNGWPQTVGIEGHALRGVPPDERPSEPDYLKGIEKVREYIKRKPQNQRAFGPWKNLWPWIHKARMGISAHHLGRNAGELDDKSQP